MSQSTLENLRFLSEADVRHLRRQFGTPLFVYDQATLEAQAISALSFPNPYGLTARYAMKACPSAAVLRVLTRMGLSIDASSGFEVRRAIRTGVPAGDILLTAQQIPDDFEEFVELGVRFNACSPNQLDRYGQRFPGNEVGIRVNPGLGSGHSNRTNVGGPSASFGVWHEHMDRILEIQAEHDLQITLLHSHIGSGSDPEVWQRCARLTLDIARRLPKVTTVNLGGGHKVGRMAGEVSTDVPAIAAPIAEEVSRFAEEHGRQLHLEIEPGTFYVANAGAVVAGVVDVVDTGSEGYRFIKVDTGMTEILRPSMYGAQHPIVVVPAEKEERPRHDYVVVGHCCESGDILTPGLDDPETLRTRKLTEARIGDSVVIEGSGAYCAGMAVKNYNSFPEAPEVLRDLNGQFHLVRQRQSLDQMLSNEIVPEFLK